MDFPSSDVLMDSFPQVKNQFVFHYTTYASALGILISGRMRLGALTNMNDPLEFQDYRDEPLESCSDNAQKQSSLWHLEYKNAVAEKERCVRLVSFSIDKPKLKDCQEKTYTLLSKGWARTRMWAQYADNHKGVCFVFDKECLVSEFKREFNPSYKPFYNEVKYTNKLESLKDALRPPCKSLLTEDKIEFLFQKCQDFRDEQEFRLLLIKKDLKNHQETVSFSIVNALCGVITGVKFPIENRVVIQRAIMSCNPKIKFFSISWDYGMPEVNDLSFV